MRKCYKTFQTKWAYIVHDIHEDISKKDPIHIDDFLQNELLLKKVKDKELFFVCRNGHILTKYDSNLRSRHFRHLHSGDINNVCMSEWHSRWQGYFKDTEVEFPKMEYSIKERRADAVAKVNDKVIHLIEFQHSYIKPAEVRNRKHDYALHGKEIIWLIDGNNDIQYMYLHNSETYLLTFTNNFWKYESFIDYDNIYINIDEKIFRIEPSKVKSRMIDVKEYKIEEEFIQELYSNEMKWNNDNMHQCILYLNQRGAGCGKTYGSIQILSKYEKFQYKKWFIYLTKVHTAKQNIYDEFKKQYKDGKLDIETIDEIDNTKQYIIRFKHKQTKNEVNVIIATIDSFIYALGDQKNSSGNNMFHELMMSIQDGYKGYAKNGCFKYASNNPKLNKECLIVIDEAQDLDKSYIQTIAHIMRDTYIDVYVIGDKLQSIWGKDNVFTFLENNELPHTYIQKDIGENTVKRFHNDKLIHFVNSIINYKEFGLPEITSICDGNCNYSHDNDKTPYDVFYQNPVYSKDTNEYKIKQIIDYYIELVRSWVENYQYLPQNFMFIFPVMKNNTLAQMLETRLTEFWANIFNDVEFQVNVLQHHPFWKTQIQNIQSGQYYKHAYLHMSDENQPINIKESEYATKLLSIHASKGLGCEIVFLLNLSEKALDCFSREDEKDMLKYESLLHVAITRQKKHIYIGYTDKNDNIYNRLQQFQSDADDIFKMKNPTKSKFTQGNEIIDYIANKHYQAIYDEYISLHKYDEYISSNTNPIDKKNIIDWGHHIIRFNVMYYTLLLEIINNNDDVSNKDQITTLLKIIKNISLHKCLHHEYYDFLYKLGKVKSDSDSSEKYKINKREFKLLNFDITKQSKYIQYVDKLHDIIEHIQDKLYGPLTRNKLPKICPLEMTVVIFLISSLRNGVYADMSIMTLYDILYYFDNLDLETQKLHQGCDCKCNEFFASRNVENVSNPEILNSMKMSIVNHYNITQSIHDKYMHLADYIKDTLKDDTSFIYNIEHLIKFDGNNPDEFTILAKSHLIAHSDNNNIIFIMRPEVNKLNMNNMNNNTTLIDISNTNTPTCYDINKNDNKDMVVNNVENNNV